MKFVILCPFNKFLILSRSTGSIVRMRGQTMQAG